MTHDASQGYPRVSISSDPDPTMGDVPLRCARCKTPTLIGVRVREGDTYSQVRFRCHACGFENDQPETYKMVKTPEGLRALFLSFNHVDLSNLRNAVAVAAAAPDTATTAEVASLVAPQAPAVAEWLKRAENRKELQQWLTLLFTGLGVLIALMTYMKATAPTPAQVNNIVVQIESGQVNADQLPRRAPCWCGSGKRYKNCHGIRVEQGAETPSPEPSDLPATVESQADIPLGTRTELP